MSITIKQGETYRKRLEITYAETKEPVDLTDVTAYCEMRTVPGGELLGIANCFVGADDGSVTVLFNSAMTDSFPVGDCGYDIWIVSQGEKHPIYSAECKVIDRYTDNIG